VHPAVEQRHEIHVGVLTVLILVPIKKYLLHHTAAVVDQRGIVNGINGRNTQFGGKVDLIGRIGGFEKGLQEMINDDPLFIALRYILS